MFPLLTRLLLSLHRRAALRDSLPLGLSPRSGRSLRRLPEPQDRVSRGYPRLPRDCGSVTGSYGRSSYGFLWRTVESIMFLQPRFRQLCGGLLQGVRRQGEALDHLQRAVELLRGGIRTRDYRTGEMFAVGGQRLQRR